jgi:hypothetical protein
MAFAEERIGTRWNVRRPPNWGTAPQIPASAGIRQHGQPPQCVPQFHPKTQKAPAAASATFRNPLMLLAFLERARRFERPTLTLAR